MTYILKVECACGDKEIEAESLVNDQGLCEECGKQMICDDPSIFTVKEN